MTEVHWGDTRSEHNKSFIILLTMMHEREEERPTSHDQVPFNFNTLWHKSLWKLGVYQNGARNSGQNDSFTL
jgi:hypothetical protein